MSIGSAVEYLFLASFPFTEPRAVVRILFSAYLFHLFNVLLTFYLTSGAPSYDDLGLDATWIYSPMPLKVSFPLKVTTGG